MAMLAPGAPPIDSVRGSGNRGITSTDVAACLIKLDRMTYLYSLSKFALDNNCRSELNLLAVKEAVNSGFKLNEHETNRTTAILALTALEIAIHPNKCNKCKGVGEINLLHRVEVCESCQGVGSRAISERNLAKILGVTLFQSRKVWKKRLTFLLSKYLERDDHIASVIFIGLRP
tara:strand:+ start:87 stop:611 length:525 start_codon:yes stop_codon:yes gene_type:complete